VLGADAGAVAAVAWRLVGAGRQCPWPWRHPRANSYSPDKGKLNPAGLLAAELHGFLRKNSHLGAS